MFCRVWCGGENWWSRPDRRQPYRCVLCLVCVGVCPAAQCDRRTHSDAERICPVVKSHRHTRQDKTAAPAYRPPPPRRRPGRQLRLAARPPCTRSDVVRNENVNTAANCSDFTRRSQFTHPDRLTRAVWIWHYVTLNVGSVVIGYSMCFCCLRLKNKIINYNDNRQFKTHVHVVILDARLSVASLVNSLLYSVYCVTRIHDTVEHFN